MELPAWTEGKEFRNITDFLFISKMKQHPNAALSAEGAFT